MKRAAKIYTALIFVFLFAPIVILLVFSFNEAKSLSVFSGFSLKWYQELFRDGETLNALKNTLILAVIASVVSTAMGTAAAVGMNRMRNKYLRAALDTATDIPMMNPDIITGISLMLMFVFFDLFSLMTSCLSAISKDFKNLLQTLSTPLFWLSGVIFDVYSMGIPAIEAILMFNPVTFFVTMYRCAVYDKMWIWEKPEAIIGFVVVFILQLIATTIIYKRTHEEVADVL